jgi:enoyl-CoA hydratase/carnithine racemase
MDLISRRKAPTVAVVEGLALGAGSGVAKVCSHRLVTETTSVATPECFVGTCLDNGANWYWPRVPYLGVGRFIGLTGA